MFRELCKLICNFLSVQFDENDSEDDENSVLDSGSLTNRTLTSKTDSISNKKSTSEKEAIKKNNKPTKKSEHELDKEKANKLLYEKRLNYLENFSTTLDIPKFFTELLKQFLSDKATFKHLKEVTPNKKSQTFQGNQNLTFGLIFFA